MANADHVPDHVATVVRSIEQIHDAHGESATRGQRALNRAAAVVSRAAFLFAVVGFVALCCAFNLLAPSFGARAFDPIPFPLLQDLGTLASLFLVILLVAAERHENELTRNRDLLELELALVSDRKLGKLIQLLEELRRDMPGVHDRTDRQANDLARSSDPQRVMEALAEGADRAENSR